MNYLNYCVSEFLIDPKLLIESGTRRKIEFSITYCSFYSLSSFIGFYSSNIWYKEYSDVFIDS